MRTGERSNGPADSAGLPLRWRRRESPSRADAPVLKSRDEVGGWTNMRQLASDLARETSEIETLIG
jgi:hypothetical protein